MVLGIALANQLMEIHQANSFCGNVDIPIEAAAVPVAIPTKRLTTMPFFPGCAELTGGEKRNCSQQKLSEYLESHAGYATGKTTHRTAGNATIEVWIGADGLVKSHRTYKAVGHGRSSDLARIVDNMMAEGIRWEPATVNGKPVSSSTMVSLHYNMVWAGGLKKKDSQSK
ncbi:hypothetical protein A3850_004030 [Lewinella sp. 4G2]|nr:hypothetical protein A3850_004030 [Lewinella sp. 4G2]